MANIAIFGGTFNPFHIGHYEMLEYVCGLDFIDKVFVMPDKIPPHKVCDFLAADDIRIKMCEIACNDFKKAELCLIEFEREGKSYTVDTMKLLHNKYPDDKFFTVIGGDMLTTLDTWYKWQDLLKMTAFIVFSRDGISNFKADLKKMENLGAEIFVAQKEITMVSSTQLRANLSKDLLPKNIYDFIKAKGIYNE